MTNDMPSKNQPEIESPRTKPKNLPPEEREVKAPDGWRISVDSIGKHYSSRELARSRLAVLVFGLVAALLIAGIFAITIIALNDKPTDAVTDFLKTMAAGILPIATLAVGYYFGQSSNSKKS